MRFEKLQFHNRTGDYLSARLDLPVDGEPVACALFAHCFTCTKNLRAVRHISEALTRRGIAVLRFDFTGLGESEGDFEETNFSSNIDDLEAAAEALAGKFESPAILIGHSLGGTAVLHAAHRIEGVSAVATIGAPFDPEHVKHLFAEALETIRGEGEAEVSLGGRPFRIRRQFVEDLGRQDTEAVIGTLPGALAIFHSPVDRIVGIENAALIFKAARHPKSFVSLDQADHLLGEASDSLYVGEVIAAWARKYVGPTDVTEPARTSPDHRVAARIGRSRYQTEVVANGHPLTSDEPVSLGGGNTGPTPYELVAAGLGACTAITLRMYADRKEWPMEAATVRVTHAKVHAEDCDCETDKTGRIDLMERELAIEGDLSEDQLQRLMQIANRCPVHRTLEECVVIKTTMSVER